MNPENGTLRVTAAFHDYKGGCHDADGYRADQGTSRSDGRTRHHARRSRVRRRAAGVERRDRPAPRGDRPVRVGRRRGRGPRLRPRARAGGGRARRRTQPGGHGRVRRRPDDRPEPAQPHRGRPGRPAGPGRRRRAAGRPGRGHRGPRAGRARRAGQPHRRGRAHPGRRHGLADPQVRAQHRQPGLGRGRHRRRPRAAASAGEHPDLFWAIRGGGGNFGVVTSFEFALHEVDPVVQFALFFWPLDQGAQALRLAREITAAMPPDINAVIGAINAPPAPFIPEEHHLTPGYVLLLTGFGPGPEHAALAAEIRQSLPPLFELVTPMPYLELQKLLDEANAWGVHAYEKGTYLAELSDPVIDVLTEHVPGKHSPMSVVLFYRLDGAYCRPGDDQTAFSGGGPPPAAPPLLGIAPHARRLAAPR